MGVDICQGNIKIPMDETAAASHDAHNIFQSEGKFGQSMVLGHRHVDVDIGRERLIIQFPLFEELPVQGDFFETLRFNLFALDPFHAFERPLNAAVDIAAA